MISRRLSASLIPFYRFSLMRSFHIQSHIRFMSNVPKDAFESQIESYKKGAEPTLLHVSNPVAIRSEFLSEHRLNSADLERISVGLGSHREPVDIFDRVALFSVKILRKIADGFFQRRYIHRAIVLETVAAVPGMVAGMIRHLNSLRKMRHDGGWIHQLLSEAENERMHLMTWMKLTQPSFLERMLVATVQLAFFNTFLLFYLCSPRTAHRFVGYLEEEAVISYTQFLKEIDSGHIRNEPAPKIAIEYWNLQKEATLRDVVLAVRADEANHRDVNHGFSDRIRLKKENLRESLDRPNEKF